MCQAMGRKFQSQKCKKKSEILLRLPIDNTLYDTIEHTSVERALYE